MSTATGFDRPELLESFRRYDQAVDVVSAFHWLYTDTENLPDTVEWFERYPRISHDDGNDATPDFSVVFKDGTGLVGEIAWIALNENSVDNLCRQIGRYDTLRRLPTANGNLVEVSRTDVLLLVPLAVGMDAVRRVLHERRDNPEHQYSPDRAPCITQFALTDSRYTFQRLPDSANGSLDADQRQPALGHWLLRSQLNTPVNNFATNKAQWAFINDPVDPLYLATRLWSHVFPSLVEIDADKGYTPIDASSADLAALLQERYRHGRVADVTRAMRLLSAAGMAEEVKDENWRIAWGEVRPRGDEVDLADAFANRASQERPPGGLIQRRKRDDRRATTNPQQPLF
jgi:hypothetical protein